MASADTDTIVVGMDGSECSNDAFEWSISEARRSGRRLVVVHAWRWTSDAIGGPLGAPHGRKEGWALLNRAAGSARDRGIPVETRLVEGSASAGLVQTAQGAAMLVVGSHGYKKLARAFLGSVSRACLEQAPCPVLVVPGRAVRVAEDQPEAVTHD
jgi:nucleotide-binding universal stress UspA family protein